MLPLPDPGLLNNYGDLHAPAAPSVSVHPFWPAGQLILVYASPHNNLAPVPSAPPTTLADLRISFEKRRNKKFVYQVPIPVRSDRHRSDLSLTHSKP